MQGQRPDLAIQSYLKLKMFKQAFEVAKKHSPNMVSEINKYLSEEGGNNADVILKKAQIFEQTKEYSKAIDTYLELDGSNFQNKLDLIKIYERAKQLSYNYEKSRYIEVTKIICKRLRDLKSYNRASEYY